MVQFIQQYRLDSIAFDLTLLAVSVIGHIWLRRQHGRGIPRVGWFALMTMFSLGYAAPEFAAQQEQRQLRDMLEGIAPTYAQELALLGYEKITLKTAPNDPTYLALIAAEIRWEAVNKNVADIYTFKRLDNGKVVLMVDSETDYNHNGVYDGERESRTRIGEPYDQVTQNMLRTFQGTPQFDEVPYSDRWGNWISCYVPIRDMAGNVDGILGVDYDATAWINAIGRNRAASLGIVAVLSAILLSSIVVVLVTRAELQMREIAEREREKLQAQLVVASRQAGMAEVATGVLHNVGNVLNSVNVSASLVSENIQKSKVPALLKATAMIRDHRETIASFLSQDEKGKLLPDYLVKLADVLVEEQHSTIDELAALSRSVDHIKQIVASQQTFAKCAEKNETFDLVQTLNDAIRINADLLEQNNVRIVRDLRVVALITADRHKLLQILVNLISNAINATKLNAGEKRIELRSEEAQAEDGSDVLRLSVGDNGVGIQPDQLEKIFSHGFTTRKDGHGFGLHSAANAARQMKGRLFVTSDGPGKGAAFTIEIPMISVGENAS